MRTSRTLRPWIVLARASNLPTIWSNCIAGYWLGGGNSWETVFLLCLAGSLLYTGGMFLNDYWDVDFDRQYKRDRPIAAGQVTRRQVGFVVLAFFLTGLLLALAINARVLLLAVILVLVITAYDFLHKRIAWAPVLMSACRFLLYLMAASAGIFGIVPRAVGFAFALACYIVGLSHLARGESKAARISSLWLLFLCAPIPIALSFNALGLALIYTLPFLVWTWRAANVAQANPARGVAALLAGIVLVDLLALSPVSPLVWLGFAGLFAAALLFQRYISAT